MPEVCSTCEHWMRLLPGHAGICRVKQRGREWNEAMALTGESESCQEWQSSNMTERARASATP